MAVHGNQFFVSGPAVMGAPLGSAYVQSYDTRTGVLDTTYPITITNPSAGTSVAAGATFGPTGNLYVVELFGGVIRRNLGSANTQSVYSAFTATGPSLLNDLAF